MTDTLSNDDITSSTKHLVIVGAGVAGLSTAWWLSKLNWKVTIVEAAPDLRSNGYMLGLSGPGYQAAEKMGIVEDLKRHHRYIDENLYLDNRGKKILKIRYHDLMKSLDWIILSRPNLVQALYKKVQEDTETTLLYSTKVTKWEQDEDKVTVELSNGETLSADLLIGADGVHSQIRQSLFDSEDTSKEYLGYYAAAFQTKDALGLKNNFLSYTQPKKLVEFYTLEDNRLASLFVWQDELQERPKSVQEAKHRVIDQYKDSHPSVVESVKLLDDNDPFFLDSLTMITQPSWHKGRVLLMGDAAHCLTLLSGQGAGVSMMSAYVLYEKLKNTNNIKTALADHDQQMRPAIERLQERSRKIAPWFIPSTPVKFNIRNFMLKRLPKRILAWYLLKAVKTDIVAAEM